MIVVADKNQYISVMLFKGVSDAVDELLGELGFWPDRAEFLREAALEKMRRERHSFDGVTWGNRSKEIDEMSEEEKKPKEEKPEEEEKEEEEKPKEE